MPNCSLLLCLGLAAGTVVGAPSVRPRAVIASDAVVGFPETVPSGIEGTLYLQYKPYLKVINGCVPFPAVDAEGNTGAGLAPTGASDGDCSSSTGQVYARAAAYEEYYAIMYSWYMPKDEPSDGIGHRHDWENAVIWLTAQSASASVVALSVSQHGGYVTTTTPSFSGTRPLVGYVSYWPLDHCLILETEVGGSQPLIAWESLTDAARTALDDTDFGDAIVAFKDSDFTSYLADSYAQL